MRREIAMIRRDSHVPPFHLMRPAPEYPVQERAPLNVRIADAMILGFCIAAGLALWWGWI